MSEDTERLESWGGSLNRIRVYQAASRRSSQWLHVEQWHKNEATHLCIEANVLLWSYLPSQSLWGLLSDWALRAYKDRQTREAHRTVFVCEMDTTDDDKAEKRRHVLIQEKWRQWCQTFDSRRRNEHTYLTSWFPLDGTNKSGLVLLLNLTVDQLMLFAQKTPIDSFKLGLDNCII